MEMHQLRYVVAVAQTRNFTRAAAQSRVAQPSRSKQIKKLEEELADLESEPLIVMKEGHCLGDQVVRFCDRGGIRPNLSFRSAQLETIQALVQAGLGVSLIPAMATKSFRTDLPVYRSFSAPRPNRTVVAAWPKARPPGRAVDEFLKLIRALFNPPRP